MSDKLKLKRCDLNECQAMCCYDGVYLKNGEEERIIATVKNYPEHFKHLPEDFIVKVEWKGIVNGKKTATRPYRFKNLNFPKHFEQTRCVFATEDHLCSLQIAAIEMGNHPWDFKPQSCWMFPLREENNRIKYPIPTNERDPYNLGSDYPGFSKFTGCGKHQEDGQAWDLVLKDEIEYFNSRKESC